MESSWSNRRVEKRGYEQSVQDGAGGHMPESKKPKLPALASVIVEAVKVDTLQRLCSSLEPMFRRIVSEEVERALTRLGSARFAGRSPPKIQGPEGGELQLQFRTRMPPHLFTGGRVEGEQGAAIHVVLVDACTGSVVQNGPESVAKLKVVVLEGDFNDEADENWTLERFESHEVKEREGKRPLLTGDLQVILKDGVGTLGDLTFTDNSSWIRSRKFRLGVKVAPGYSEGIRVREAKTEAFAVKDHRGELYKKHYPPVLDDEVWRLDRIAKDGALHKKLVKADVITVEDFLRILVRDPQKLRNLRPLSLILNPNPQRHPCGMSNRMWENTVEHAKTCVLGAKLYIYYADGNHKTGVVFNHIYELSGLIADGHFLPLESLAHSQKVTVDYLVKRAYDNWHQVVEYDGKVLNSLASSKNTGKQISAAPVVDNCVPNQYIASTQTRQNYNTLEPSQQCHPVNNHHPSVPQLIEFPFVRSDQNPMMTINNPQPAVLSGSLDYIPHASPAAAPGPYISGDWPRQRNGQGLEDFFTEEIRLRSSEMLEGDDMQRLLRTFSMGVGGGMGGPGFGHPDDCYSYSIQAYEPEMDRAYTQERSRGSGKAVVGWLKLKAALRWGIFIRKRAAERRAQLVELD